MRIIVVEERDDHWTALFANRPEVACGGRTATEAVYRLTGADEESELNNLQRPGPGQSLP